jgi:basic amino acid/polyamine antiporter, APA family
VTSKYSPNTATAVIIANMIGTGVFTSLGFQLLGIQSGFVLLLLWVVGGVMALCGALTYAELGAALPRSGGEYHFLSKIYHPSIGFTSGWISSSIGFSAPTALAAITFGSYLSSVLQVNWVTPFAIGILLLMTLVHASTRKNSGLMQQIFTWIKLLLIVIFCVIGVTLVSAPQPINFVPIAGDKQLIFSSLFAVSLIYVNYAYNGWNAATYVINELEHPKRDLPKILIIGTSIVTLCYVALNAVFLYVAPVDALVGKVEVGFVAAQYIMGEQGANIMGIIMALLLISTVSAMTLAGPRVLQVIGQDFNFFKPLSVTNQDGIPTRAIYFQSLLALIFIVTSSFESILIFSGFALAASNFLTVFGIFVLRRRQPDLARPYKTWLYPIPPLLYISISGWTLVYLVLERTQEALWSIGIILLGFGFYFFSKQFEKPKTN